MDPNLMPVVISDYGTFQLNKIPPMSIPPLMLSPQYYLGVDLVILGLQVISLICNGFITKLFIRSPKLRQNKSLFLVILLCVTDLAFAIISIPYTIYLITHWRGDYFNYDNLVMMVTAAPVILQFKLNLVITIMIAIDRLQAVKQPMKYRHRNHFLFATLTLAIGLSFGVFDITFEAITMDFANPRYNCTALGCFQSKTFRAFWGISNMTLNVIALVLTIWVTFELKKFHQKAITILKQKKLTPDGTFKASETAASNKLSFGILLISFIFLLIPSTFVGVIEFLEIDLFAKIGPFYMVGLLFAGISNGGLYITLHAGIRQAAAAMFPRRVNFSTKKSQVTITPVGTVNAGVLSIAK